MISGENNNKVSIIVVNWNGERFLKDCLGALSNQSYANSEIIVVDNGSSDESRSSRSRPRVTSLASAPIDRIACLVVDIRMDGMNGLDLQERLVAERPAFPIIFITAHDDEPTRLRVRQAGAAAYLPKPFAGATLLAAVRNAAGPA